MQRCTKDAIGITAAQRTWHSESKIYNVAINTNKCYWTYTLARFRLIAHWENMCVCACGKDRDRERETNTMEFFSAMKLIHDIRCWIVSTVSCVGREQAPTTDFSWCCHIIHLDWIVCVRLLCETRMWYRKWYKERKRKWEFCGEIMTNIKSIIWLTICPIHYDAATFWQPSTYFMLHIFFEL